MTPTNRYRVTAGSHLLYCFAPDKIAARAKFLDEFGVPAGACELLD